MDRSSSIALHPRLLILLKAARGHHLVDVRTILYAEADARFSRMFFTDGTDKVVFHTLTELEGILCCGERIGDLLFVRVHRGHLVAVHHAMRMEGRSLITLQGDHRLPISKGQWPLLLETMGSIRSKR